ncbi:GNAT family N-acetyltransferase [Pseudomonas sp. NPDC098740]|uniref:GNAT family N-acetyltransferase n=1 Tax=Pseudomonas sp. NPDC098740 TaxID=3364486 RepID=UPI00383B7767
MELSLPLQLHSMSLRAPDPSLCKPLQEALNASYVAHFEFLPWARSHTSEDEARAFLLRAADDFNSETGERRLFIVADDGQAVIGCIGLKPRRRNRYVVGYWANTEYSGKGYMRRALELLVKSLPGCTFYLTTSSANGASQQMAKASGFELIRMARQARHSECHGVQDTYLYRLKLPQEIKQQAKKSPREGGQTVVS